MVGQPLWALMQIVVEVDEFAAVVVAVAAVAAVEVVQVEALASIHLAHSTGNFHLIVRLLLRRR